MLPGLTGFTLAGLLIALGAASAWDRALLRSARSVRAIEIPASGPACIVLRNAETVPAEAIGGAGVNRYWVALATRSPARRGILITGDMLQGVQFRLLRLWALWGRLPVAPGQLRG